MSLLHKAATLGRLAVRFDLQTLRHRLRANLNPTRLRWHNGKPFVHRDPGFPFVCMPNWPDSVEQFQNNQADHWELAVLRTWLAPDELMFDLGANLGMYTFAAANRVGVMGLVVSVEAAPYIVSQLEACAKILRCPQVRVVHAAVTDRPGTVTFFVAEAGANTTEQSLHPSAAQRAHSQPVEVPARTLRDLQSEFAFGRMLSAIKIDIEGAEAAALSATPAEWFGREAPLWILEINPGSLARFGATPWDIVRRFPAADFDGWILPKHPLFPQASTSLRRVDALGADWNDSLYYNFFAIPRSPRFAAHRARISRCFA